MANFFSLPIADQAKLSQDSLFKYYGVTVPVTTEQSKNNLIKAQNSFGPALNQINNLLWQGPITLGSGPNPATAARARAANNAPIPPEIKNELTGLLPAGYTFDGTLGQLANTLNAMSASVDNVVRNEIQLPPTGAGVTYNPNNTTPPVGTVVTPTTPTLPTNTAPATTTAPSTNTSSSTISNILTAAAVIGGGALIVNALNNRVQNSTVPIVPTPEVNTDPEIPVDQETINPNSDPNTNIGAEGQNQDAEIPIDKPNIDPNSDPNTNIGTEGQTVTSPSSITENVFDPRQDAQESVFDPRQEVQESVFDPTAGGSGQGISTALNNTRGQATKGDTTSSQQKLDWRAKLSLAPKSNYLYNVKKGQAGILNPLQETNGVIFPYTPAISVTYAAGYDTSELVHSNYKIYQYKGSSVDAVSITADFTAQDTNEANYLLAVIHFFRSVTKMFYGQDQDPKAGVPPPLCYLSGFGAYTFDAHPLVVTNFTYATPTDVDYIRAGSQTNQPGQNVSQQNSTLNTFSQSVQRTTINGLKPAPPNFQTQNSLINSEATYVPTKIQLQITCIPIVTRNDISNTFSLEKYATGQLLRGSKRSGGGIW